MLCYVRASENGDPIMKLTYWSHSCFLLETGTHRLVIDPFLTGNPKAPIKADAVKCGFVLVSHGHNDHVGDAVSIARRNNATIIANYEIATFCSQQGANVHPLHIGGSHPFPFGRVKLTIAHHGSGYETDTGFLYMGNPTGILITAEGKTVYHAGDTGLFLDMQLIGRLNRIDVALLPIGDNFTMGVEDAVEAVAMLKPQAVIPMHYDTFDVIHADPAEFTRKAATTGVRVNPLRVGESIEF
jgi:L-ascorbate metabolism protein UlaG (beta-lactamase superfamily)